MGVKYKIFNFYYGYHNYDEALKKFNQEVNDFLENHNVVEINLETNPTLMGDNTSLNYIIKYYP